MSGYVYFIACSYATAVKIGYTRSNPFARMAALQTGCPHPLDLMAFFPGTMEDERRLHETFEPLLLHGEWFVFEGKLEDLVWYIQSDGTDRRVSRERFEDGICDCVLGEIGPWTDPRSARQEPWFYLQEMEGMA